ncbi:MAG: hypothetical protein NT175_05140 [Bacteroidetes bacterium]|nr:hypothetical protein [Bacteroidota bacterium]
MRKIIFFINLFITVTLSSQTSSTAFTPGVIIDTVWCDSDPQQSYALYLPSGYNPSQKWPVVYIFEPGARGALPLQSFSKAAETYGYILICSNNSQNGPWDPIFKAGDAMMKDSQKKFSINTDRIYTCGFSGGARAASTVAVLTGKVAGVIGCGAGLAREPKYQPGINATFSFVGMVGDCDMNYLEVTNLQDKLTELRISNKLIIFSGTHEWPPEKAAIQAFDWLELQAMRKNLIPRNDSVIQILFDKNLLNAQHEEKAGNFYQSYRIYNDMATDFEELMDISAIKNKVAELGELKSVKAAIKDEEDFAQRETKQQLLCLEAIRDHTNGTLDSAAIEWWKSEIKYLNSLVRSSDSVKSKMGKRLKQMIIYGCYEDGNTYKRNYQYQKAIVVHEILAIVMPDDEHPFFELAKEYAILGESRESLRNLQKAIDNGFNDIDKINSEPAFQGMKDNRDFQKIVKKLIPEM